MGKTGGGLQRGMDSPRIAWRSRANNARPRREASGQGDRPHSADFAARIGAVPVNGRQTLVAAEGSLRDRGARRLPLQ